MSHITINYVILWFSWRHKFFVEILNSIEKIFKSFEKSYFHDCVSAHYYTTDPILKYIQLGLLAGNFYMFSKLLIVASEWRISMIIFLNILVDSN